MPKFQYSATDAGGVPRQGEVEAANANEAIRLLSGQGLRVSQISSGGSMPSRAVPAPSVPRTVAAPLAASPPLAKRSTSLPSAPLRTLPVHRTKILSNKELYLFFIQLSNLLRSGITPSEALQQLAMRFTREDVREACRQMAGWTTEGRGLHEAMAAYPDLFPSAVRGAMESGAMGGYLWEAAEMVAEQRRSTHALQRALWFVWWAFLSLFGAVLVGVIGKDAVNGAIDYVNTGQGDYWGAIAKGLRQGIMGATGVAVVVMVVPTIFLRYWFRSKPSRPLRHRLAFRMPMAKKRTINECFTHFSWHLGKLARAGISPFASYRVAASAVPNDAYSEELLRNVGSRPDSVKLSSILYESSLFPREYAATVETGEMTGRVGEALDQASALSLQEVKEQERYVKFRIGCWAILAVFLSGIIGFGIIYATYLQGSFRILDDVENSQPTITRQPDIRQ